MPSWFNVIEQWREKRMGSYGVTLPFLVGAISLERGRETASLQEVHALLTEMIEHPVEGYMTVIRWCGDIEEPVLSMKRLDDPFKISIKDGFLRPDEKGMSIAFTEDLMSMFNLDCKDANECRKKLAEYAAHYVESGVFSKSLNPETGQRKFGNFSTRDIEFIMFALRIPSLSHSTSHQ